MSQGPSITQDWGMPLDVFYCAHCHSAHLAPQEVTLSTCPACLQAEVSSEPARMRREPPELAIPFAMDVSRAGEALAAWVNGGWFRPPDLQAEMLFADKEVSWINYDILGTKTSRARIPAHYWFLLSSAPESKKFKGLGTKLKQVWVNA